MSKNKLKMLKQIFLNHCRENNYQMKERFEKDCARLDITNIHDVSIVKIYTSGSILIQGKENPLKSELEKLKSDIEKNPKKYLGVEFKPTHVNYKIILEDLQNSIKNTLQNLGGTLILKEKPKDSIIYKATIIRNHSLVALTQFSNGSLLVQGKSDFLLNELCEIIERIGKPSENEVILRYISDNQIALQEMSKKHTPQILEGAKIEVKQKLGEAYSYLSDYNRTLFVVAQCLCNYQLDLPEHSVNVMPASKGFEGFVKKLMVDIKLVSSDYFKTNTSFSPLMDSKSQLRKNLCRKNSKIHPFLKRISSTMDMYRHFFMHSDESLITRIDDFNDAERKVNELFMHTREIFEYFNSIFYLL